MFGNFVRSLVLSCLAASEASRIYHVYFILLCITLLTFQIVKNSHILAGIYFVFLKYKLDQT